MKPGLDDLEKISPSRSSTMKRARGFPRGTRDHDVSQNIEALLRHIAGEPPFTILDFGCGPGRDLKAFKALGQSPSASRRRALRRDGARRVGVRVWQQDFLKLDLPEARFDGVFANAALFHVRAGAAARAATTARGAQARRRALLLQPARGKRGRLEPRPLRRVPRSGRVAPLDVGIGIHRARALLPARRIAARAAPWLASAWRRPAD